MTISDSQKGGWIEVAKNTDKAVSNDTPDEHNKKTITIRFLQKPITPIIKIEEQKEEATETSQISADNMSLSESSETDEGWKLDSHRSEQFNLSQEDNTGVITPQKRGRGRPKKIFEGNDTTDKQPENVSRKRGRPPKPKPESTGPVVKRKRGRPPKPVTEKDEYIAMYKKKRKPISESPGQLNQNSALSLEEDYVYFPVISKKKFAWIKGKHFLWIPSVLLARIFGFLCDPLDLIFASGVCKEWNAVIANNDGNLWRGLLMKRPPTVINMNVWVETLLKKFIPERQPTEDEMLLIAQNNWREIRENITNINEADRSKIQWPFVKHHYYDLVAGNLDWLIDIVQSEVENVFRSVELTVNLSEITTRYIPKAQKWKKLYALAHVSAHWGCSNCYALSLSTRILGGICIDLVCNGCSVYVHEKCGKGELMKHLPVAKDLIPVIMNRVAKKTSRSKNSLVAELMATQTKYDFGMTKRETFKMLRGGMDVLNTFRKRWGRKGNTSHGDMGNGASLYQVLEKAKTEGQVQAADFVVSDDSEDDEFLDNGNSAFDSVNRHLPSDFIPPAYDTDDDDTISSSGE